MARVRWLQKARSGRGGLLRRLRSGPSIAGHLELRRRTESCPVDVGGSGVDGGRSPDRVLHLHEEPPEIAQHLVAGAVTAPPSLVFAIEQISFQGIHCVRAFRGVADDGTPVSVASTIPSTTKNLSRSQLLLEALDRRAWRQRRRAPRPRGASRCPPVPSPRLERGTYGLGNRRSIHLSYEGKNGRNLATHAGVCNGGLRHGRPRPVRTTPWRSRTYVAGRTGVGEADR